MEARVSHGGAEERAAGARARSDHLRWAPGWAQSLQGVVEARVGEGGRRVLVARGRPHLARGCARVASEPPAIGERRVCPGTLVHVDLRVAVFGGEPTGL